MQDEHPFLRTYQHAMQLWFVPEIERRQETGLAENPYDLRAAQVIMHSDNRPHEIRLNDEVAVVGDARLRRGISKAKGDPILLGEIDGITNWRLPDSEDPNCGHFTMVRLGNDWYLTFDFRYTKAHARVHLEAASEFLNVATLALAREHLRAAADNLFSAAELGATAYVMTVPVPGGISTKSHGFVHSQFNLLGRNDNVEQAQTKAFNILSQMRPAARYLRQEFTATGQQLSALKTTVSELLNSVGSHLE